MAKSKYEGGDSYFSDPKNRREWPRGLGEGRKPNVQHIYSDWNVRIERIELFNEEGKIVGTLSPFNKVKTSDFVQKASREVGELWPGQEFTDRYGVTPSKAAKIANGVIYEKVVKPHPEWAKLCRKSSWVPTKAMARFLEHEALMKQCVKDRTQPLIPLVALFGTDSKGLKELFGKTMWKRVVKNSYTRNRTMFLEIVAGEEYIHDHNLAQRRLRLFLEMNEFPSTLLGLRRIRNHNYPYWMYEKALKEHKIPMYHLDPKKFHAHTATEPGEVVITKTKPEQVWDDVITIQDTFRMAEQMGEPFDPKWSYRRIKEEHARLTLLREAWQARKRAEADAEYAARLTIDIPSLHQWCPSLCVDGVYARPLQNMLEVQDEGTRQKHCVGSYAEECARGKYIVYSLEKDGVKSTLGIRVQDRNTEEGVQRTYRLEQHYLACNRRIEDKSVDKCAEVIVELLNQQNTPVKEKK